MSQTVTLNGTARAMADLERAFDGHPGVTDAAHTATWHVAGMIEQLRGMHEDFAELLRRRELSAGSARPDEETT